MRQLDVFQTYFDNKDNPLVGRVRFCTLQGAAQNVFKYDDGDYTSLGDTLYTNSSGRFTEQIFLSDADYLLYFERYNGTASMETDDDDDIWETVGVARNLYDTINIEVTSSYLQGVNTIADLRTTLPSSVTSRRGVKAVALLGYSAVGDKSPVTYTWSSASTENDDDGSIIKVADVEVGRWKLRADTGIVNTRDFGVFPSTIEPSITNRTRLAHAEAYAYNNGYILMAHKTGCYDVANLTMRCKFMTAGEGVILACPTGYSATIENADASVHAAQNIAGSMTGTITIKGETLYISQNLSYANADLCTNIRLRPTKMLVMDKTYANVVTANALTYSNIDVMLTANQSVAMNLTNCRIFGDYKITSIAGSSFTNCIIKRSQFSSNLTLAEICSVCHNCRTERSFWDTQDDYEAFVASQDVSVYEKYLSAANLAVTTGHIATLSATTTTTVSLSSTVSQLGWATSTREIITMGFVPPIVSAETYDGITAAIATKLGTNTPMEFQMMLVNRKSTVSGVTYNAYLTPIYWVVDPILNPVAGPYTVPGWFWLSHNSQSEGACPTFRALSELFPT